MNKQITTTEQNKITFSQDAKELIKKTVAEGLTDLEFDMFMYQAQRTGLDPMTRQIYVIKNKDKVNIQATIDGLRLIAERCPEYAGQDEPVWDGALKTTDFNAKVTVYRFSPTGVRYPAAVGVAYWPEYCAFTTDYQTHTKKIGYMWDKMPRLMLAKVAEALALRKAFPQELSGIYTPEEMDQVDVAPHVIISDKDPLLSEMIKENMEVQEKPLVPFDAMLKIVEETDDIKKLQLTYRDIRDNYLEDADQQRLLETIEEKGKRIKGN